LISDQKHNRPEAIVDGEGLIAALGLIDIQINGGFGLDFTADPSAIWEVGSQRMTLPVDASKD
jgi:N-acetylglucosamine-6-phosphate deacetylase